jgi:hypothetical protein
MYSSTVERQIVALEVISSNLIIYPKMFKKINKFIYKKNLNIFYYNLYL